MKIIKAFLFESLRSDLKIIEFKKETFHGTSLPNLANLANLANLKA